MPKRSLPVAERFWPRVDKNGPVPSHAPELGPCWIWTGYRRNGRYPWMYYAGRPVAAYRVAYILLVGPIPEGLQIDHLCRVVFCVNPVHLEPVTQKENIRRQIAAITHCAQGHPYDAENTAYANPTGRIRYRYCRICTRANASRYRKSLANRLCEFCGRSFKPGDTRTRFCGNKCARQAQLRRKLPA